MRMKKSCRLLPRRIVWTIAGALAGVSVPVMVGLVLKALGLTHGVSLHAWLLNEGGNEGRGEAAGGLAAAIAGALNYYNAFMTGLTKQKAGANDEGNQ
jgi:hypothetical protein